MLKDKAIKKFSFYVLVVRGNLLKELSQPIVNPVNNKIQEKNKVSNFFQDFFVIVLLSLQNM